MAVVLALGVSQAIVLTQLWRLRARQAADVPSPPSGQPLSAGRSQAVPVVDPGHEEVLDELRARITTLEQRLDGFLVRELRQPVETGGALGSDAIEPDGWASEDEELRTEVMSQARQDLARRRKEQRMAQAATALVEEHGLAGFPRGSLEGVLGFALARKRSLERRYRDPSSGPGGDVIARIRNSPDWGPFLSSIEDALLQAHVCAPSQAAGIAFRIREECLTWDQEYQQDG